MEANKIAKREKKEIMETFKSEAANAEVLTRKTLTSFT